MDVAAVLEITAAETDVDATLSGSCCFYAAVAAAMAASADLPQKVRKQRGVYAPLFSFWKNSFFLPYNLCFSFFVHIPHLFHIQHSRRSPVCYT